MTPQLGSKLWVKMIQYSITVSGFTFGSAVQIIKLTMTGSDFIY
jgi:hypothetical protein